MKKEPWSLRLGLLIIIPQKGELHRRKLKPLHVAEVLTVRQVDLSNMVPGTM